MSPLSGKGEERDVGKKDMLLMPMSRVASSSCLVIASSVGRDICWKEKRGQLLLPPSLPPLPSLPCCSLPSSLPPSFAPSSSPFRAVRGPLGTTFGVLTSRRGEGTTSFAIFPRFRPFLPPRRPPPIHDDAGLWPRPSCFVGRRPGLQPPLALSLVRARSAATAPLHQSPSSLHRPNVCKTPWRRTVLARRGWLSAPHGSPAPLPPPPRSRTLQQSVNEWPLGTCCRQRPAQAL